MLVTVPELKNACQEKYFQDFALHKLIHDLIHLSILLGHSQLKASQKKSKLHKEQLSKQFSLELLFLCKDKTIHVS